MRYPPLRCYLERVLRGRGVCLALGRKPPFASPRFDFPEFCRPKDFQRIPTDFPALNCLQEGRKVLLSSELLQGGQGQGNCMELDLARSFLQTSYCLRAKHAEVTMGNNISLQSTNCHAHTLRYRRKNSIGPEKLNWITFRDAGQNPQVQEP